jgi:hypothetical protein
VTPEWIHMDTLLAGAADQEALHAQAIEQFTALASSGDQIAAAILAALAAGDRARAVMTECMVMSECGIADPLAVQAVEEWTYAIEKAERLMARK